jgi:hypothetical protein
VKYDINIKEDKKPGRKLKKSSGPSGVLPPAGQIWRVRKAYPDIEGGAG